jgi:hypothetical protein
MRAHAVSYDYSHRTTSLVPFSSMSNIHQWLGGIPQTGSWLGLSTAPGQAGRPRSSSCPASFPYRRTSYTVSEQPPDNAPSTESPTSHDSDDGSPADESDTVYAPSCTVSALSWPPGRPWASWSPPQSSSSSDDPDDPDNPDDPDHNPPQQPPPAPAPRPQSHPPFRFTGPGDDARVYSDFRSPWRAWQRERNEKEKYHGFRVVHRRQLHPPEDEPQLSARDKRALYKLAQQGSRPFDNHHHRRHIDNVYRPPLLSRKAVDRRRKHVDKVRGTLGQRVDRRREERKYRKAILEAGIEDFRPRTWSKNRRRRGQLLLTSLTCWSSCRS